MRLIKAFKNLIMHYPSIIPTYVVATLFGIIIFNVAPVVGPIVFLPLSVGVAHVMLCAVTKEKKVSLLPVGLGFKENYYRRNLLFLFLRQIAYLAPLMVGGLVAGIVSGRFFGFDLHFGFLTLNFIIFAVPSALVSLMFSMVPLLLADPRFDQRKHNPLLVSAYIMKGNYLKLLFVRLFFAPWLALTASGFLVSLISFYERFFEIDSGVSRFILPFGLLTPLLFLVMNPWYQMVHAQLYGTLRHKVRGYRR